MSYPEHLIENALSALEKRDAHDARKAFFENEINTEMARSARISLETVWEMANYVILTWYPYKEFVDGK